ncbi:hypothetical protein TI39_contig307g00010 [Zymoseptoria brevis]|uniref:Uncharacterized protein n=1 Tax=Zymoseptoria brevis TaxID=1047168 RepID=A0A0F4GVB9_9PEZI|nr:hypothetical protein TI39_contig307g00010 [Zymoseptoria brevis]
MRFHQALITAFLLTPHLITATPNPHPNEEAGFSFNELFARYECAGTQCGYYNQLCCTWGSSCVTDSAQRAQCTSDGGGGAQVTQAAGGTGGYWQTYTTTWVETDYVTKTAVLSTYIGGAQPTAATCNYALNEVPCGSTCCASGQYCMTDQMICAAAAGGGSSGYYSTQGGATAGAGIRPTSSAGITVTKTQGPTATLAFMTPVATGANITLTEDNTGGGGGLSGGAIAGIVIGVLLGLALLGLLCFCCCVKGLLDGLFACFGSKRKRRTVEVDEYTRHSRHSGGGNGRTWYGAARPATRVSRRDDHSSKGKNALGIGAGLAALWAILGLKRKRDNRRRDEKSEYSYSSDYYTSASSASSDDRRTRDTRRSMSRR